MKLLTAAVAVLGSLIALAAYLRVVGRAPERRRAVPTAQAPEHRPRREWAAMAAPSLPVAGGPKESEEPPLEARAALQQKRREIYQEREQSFAAEPVDGAWSWRTTDALRQAVQAIPSGYEAIDAIQSRSTESRIEATFSGPEQYNAFM